MDDLNSAISSILGDPQKMEQLREVAQSLGMNTGGSAGGASPSDDAQPQSGQNGGFDPTAIASMMKAFQGMGSGAQNTNSTGDTQSTTGAGGFNPGLFAAISQVMNTYNNQNDKNVNLLRALKPHFSPTRAGRIDDAVRIMQLMRTWPILRDSGLLSGFGNLFGGGGSK